MNRLIFPLQGIGCWPQKCWSTENVAPVRRENCNLSLNHLGIWRYFYIALLTYSCENKYVYQIPDVLGSLKHSPFFYGFYTDQKKTKEGYPLPLSYFMTGMGVYIYSFIAILRKFVHRIFNATLSIYVPIVSWQSRMAKNSRQSKLSEKEDECAFSWKLFCSWGNLPNSRLKFVDKNNSTQN